MQDVRDQSELLEFRVLELEEYQDRVSVCLSYWSTGARGVSGQGKCLSELLEFRVLNLEEYQDSLSVCLSC